MGRVRRRGVTWRARVDSAYPSSMFKSMLSTLSGRGGSERLGIAPRCFAIAIISTPEKEASTEPLCWRGAMQCMLSVESQCIMSLWLGARSSTSWSSRSWTITPFSKYSSPGARIARMIWTNGIVRSGSPRRAAAWSKKTRRPCFDERRRKRGDHSSMPTLISSQPCCHTIVFCRASDGSPSSRPSSSADCTICRSSS